MSIKKIAVRILYSRPMKAYQSNWHKFHGALCRFTQFNYSFRHDNTSNVRDISFCQKNELRRSRTHYRDWKSCFKTYWCLALILSSTAKHGIPLPLNELQRSLYKIQTFIIQWSYNFAHKAIFLQFHVTDKIISQISTNEKDTDTLVLICNS